MTTWSGLELRRPPLKHTPIWEASLILGPGALHREEPWGPTLGAA